jgi:hypothetical protein
MKVCLREVRLSGAQALTGRVDLTEQPGRQDCAGDRSRPDPDQIGSELHERFTASHQQGNLITPQQSARALLTHLDSVATGEIWDVSDPA